ncbi:MAG: hypothetical protein IJR58_07370 [Lachnospiraceae bacterium]|nr:hypothetical protein [Lachnospiraceae bacterium]
MKAVVLEVKNGYAAVMKEDGTVVKVRRDCEVGETIEVRKHSGIRKFSKATQLIAAAAAAILVFTGTFGYNYLGVEAYSYVSVDVNPSIEYTLNRLDRVVAVEAVNEEAEAVVSALEAESIKNKPIEEALAITEEVLSENGYLADEEACMLVNIAPGDEGRKERLEAAASNAFRDRPDDGRFEITTATPADRHHAREFGISAGRYEEIRRIEAGKQGLPPKDMKPDAEMMKRHHGDSIRDLFEAGGRIPPKTPDGMPQIPPGPPGK